jgi:hypothetical protein
LKRSYARIRAALQDKRNGSISSLKVVEQDEDGNDEIVEIQDPEEIQEWVLDRNCKHFKQSHETPFFH